MSEIKPYVMNGKMKLPYAAARKGKGRFVATKHFFWLYIMWLLVLLFIVYCGLDPYKEGAEVCSFKKGF